MTKEDLSITYENNIFYCTKNNTKWISVDGEKWYGEEKRIAELEKENAELKEKLNFSTQYYQGEKAKDQLTKAKEIIEELSKSLFLAKGIVRDLIDDTVDFKESKERATYYYEQEKFDTYKKAEKFISEVEK